MNLNGTTIDFIKSGQFVPSFCSITQVAYYLKFILTYTLYLELAKYIYAALKMGLLTIFSWHIYCM